MSDDAPGPLDLLGEPDGVELLQRTPLFKSLGFEETRRLAALLRVERAPRGHVVIAQDSVGDALYVVRSGQIDVYVRDLGGKRHLMNRLGPGELFGEMSLVDDVLVSADCEVTSEEAELLVIPGDRFQELLASDDHLAARIYRAFCRTLTDRLRNQTRVWAERMGRRPG